MKKITIEDFEKSIDDWEILKVQKDQIYKTSKYNFFKTDLTIKIEETDIQQNPLKSSIFFPKTLYKNIEKNSTNTIVEV